MKILIHNNNFDLSTGGGAERYVLDIIAGLKDREHEVFTSTNTQHLEKVDIVYVNNCIDTSLLEKLQSKPCVRFIHDHKIYCPGTPKYWFCSEQQCRINTDLRCIYYAFSEHCQSRNPLKFLPATLGKQNELAVNRKFKKLIVASDFMKEMLLCHGFSEEQVVVNTLFPYGEVADDKKNASNLQLIKEEPPLVLYVGRIFKEKGVDYLIKAAALLKQDFKLVIIGTGWEEAYCKKLSLKLGLQQRIHFTGFLKPDEISEYYKKCRLVVVPSVWPEPFGLIGLEAYQFSKPVVAFDTGGISHWLKNEQNGFMVERLNTKRLAEKIDILLSDKELSDTLGKNGYNMLQEQFTFKRHLDNLEKVFTEVVSSNTNVS